MTKEEIKAAIMGKPVNEVFNRPEVQDIFRQIDDEVHQAQAKHNAIMQGWIEAMCATRVEPPIRGGVTKGKMRWRGVTLQVSNPEYNVTHYVLSQRGKPISEFEVRHINDFKNYTTTVLLSRGENRFLPDFIAISNEMDWADWQGDIAHHPERYSWRRIE